MRQCTPKAIVPAVIQCKCFCESVSVASLKHDTDWIFSSPAIFTDLFGADSDHLPALSGIKIGSRPEQKAEAFLKRAG